MTLPTPTSGFPDRLIFLYTNTDAFDFFNLWSFFVVVVYSFYIERAAAWGRDLAPSLPCGTSRRAGLGPQWLSRPSCLIGSVLLMSQFGSAAVVEDGAWSGPFSSTHSSEG